MQWDTVCKSNIGLIDQYLSNHMHEEADTLIILHALEVSRRNPFQGLFIIFSDTDVFLLLLHFYQSLCAQTIFPLMW